jgi:hypothetical protein
VQDDRTPDRADRDADLAAQEEAYWAEIRSEEEYRSCDGPFCGGTHDKLGFLEVAGILDDDGLTRYGERVFYLWSTDPARGPRRWSAALHRHADVLATAAAADSPNSPNSPRISFGEHVEPEGGLVLTGV